MSAKPRIYMSHGEWRCYERGFYNRAIGFGDSPAKAYETWLSISRRSK